MKSVAVTGASGFVGRAVLARLLREPELEIRAALQFHHETVPPGVRPFVVGDLTTRPDLRDVLAGADAVVHLAARVHVMRDRSRDPLGEFRRVNTDATERLAREARASGVSRFVFVSSVKVHGEEGVCVEDDPVSLPLDPYARSKLEAEERLRLVSGETGLEVVVVRPPLVYGPGVKANFASLIRAVERGLPLPFGAVRNKRSLVAAANLADFLLCCCRHPAAANHTFLVSDQEDLSTPELIRRLASALGRDPRLLSVPPAWLAYGAALTGQRPAARRLLTSLVVSPDKVRTHLGWRPAVSVDEGLRAAVGGGR